MVRKAALVGVLALVAAPSMAQTTFCNPSGSGMVCNTITPPPPPPMPNYTVPTVDLSDYLARSNAERRAREADAYSKVGALISQGDCVGANRLAAFYGNRKLIEATARACPQ